MANCPDHPVIANMERTGYPDGEAPQNPRCPVCGDECEAVYLDRAGDVAGCDCCLSPWDAGEREECFETENDIKGVFEDDSTAC